MYLFWIISSVFIFQIILILDFLLKLIYITYYQNKYRSILNLFLNELYNRKNNLKIRRVKSDDIFIFSLISFFHSNRVIEYEGDKKGNIKILSGLKEKNIKPLFSNYLLSAPINISVPDNNLMKKNYKSLIEKYSFGNNQLIKYGPLQNKIIDYKNLEIFDDNYNEKREEKVKDLVKKVYDERKTNIHKLEKIINLDKFINECINLFRKKDIITREEIDDLIIDKVHNYANSNEIIINPKLFNIPYFLN
jgi:hypothetical protein